MCTPRIRAVFSSQNRGSWLPRVLGLNGPSTSLGPIWLGPRTQDPGPRTQGRAHPGGRCGRIQGGGGLLQKADIIGHGEECIVVPQEPGGGRESEVWCGGVWGSGSQKGGAAGGGRESEGW